MFLKCTESCKKLYTTHLSYFVIEMPLTESNKMSSRLTLFKAVAEFVIIESCVFAIIVGSSGLLHGVAFNELYYNNNLQNCKKKKEISLK